MAKTKVFGIGLNKTGTTTLGACMHVLGYRHLSWQRDLLKLYRDGHVDQVLEYMDGFDSFEDWPYPLMYRDLWERYGDSARYILTTRASPQKWLSSIEAQSLFTPPLRHCRKLAYGHNYPQSAPEEYLAFYDTHNNQVRDFFASAGRSDLLLDLCWEKGDGWQELCAFLEVPIPDEPLPTSNVSSARQKSGYENYNRVLVQLSKARRRLFS